MLLVEENHVQTKSTTSEGQMIFSISDGGRFDLSHEGNSNFSKIFKEAIEEPSEKGGASTPNKVGKICHLHATIAERSGRHHGEECRKRRSESASPSQQLTNYAANAEYVDYDGLFMMRHRASSMVASDSANSVSTSKSEDVWFFDSSASHHMTSH